MKYLAFLSCLLVAVVSTPLRAATTVGTTTGQFATTPSGGMTYSIPLALPEGAGGVKPQIAITYSSQGGYGILGQGWSVSGSQAITRCPSTVAQDGRYDPVDFDSYDRFCLNGARLVVHGSGSYGAVGTEYRTEVDQFSKVVSYGGSNRNPSYFKVWTKSGDILHFGRYGNSRLPSSGKAIEWHLSRVEDRFGNYISYSYAQGTYFDGSYYFRLGTIDYSQNLNVNPGQAAYSIVLGYADGEDTPAVRTRMSAGVAIKLDRRLEEIEVRSNTSSSSLLRRYSFFYRGYNNLGMSQLASISECGADGECLPPTTFDWTSKFDAGVSVSQETFETHIGDLNDSIWGWVDMGRLKYGDFNADGFLDIYRVNGRNRTTPGTVYINDGNGNFPSYLQRQGPQHYVSDDQHDANFDVSTIRAIDINSDGYTDLYKIERGATGTVRDIVWLNNGNGTFANSQSIGALTPITPHYNSILGSSVYRQRALDDLGRVMFGEFNGDGYPDILYVNGHRSTAPVQIFINQSGQGFANPYNGPSLYVHDVSGGTRRDIARVKIIDLNSDGLDDVYIVKGADSAQQDEIYLNNGTGGFHTVKLSIATYVRNHDIIGKGDVNRIRFGDFNGDGFADLYYVEGTASSAIDTIYLNDGLGNFSSDRTINGPSTYVSIDDGDTRRYTLSMNRIKNVDYNADGLTDVYIVRGDYSAEEDKIWLNKGDGTWSPVFGPDTFVDGSSREALHRTIFDVARLVVADFTGDGLPDIFRINGLDGSEDDSLYIQIGSPLHVVDKITTGLGEEHVINYGFLTNPSLYERGCDLSANDSDTFDVINAMPVVREHFIKGASDEKLHHNSYTYAGLCADRTGRGSLGFEEVTTKNQITGVKEIAVRYQKFPKTGMLRNKRVERSNGDPIRISDLTYSDIEWGNSIYFYQSIEEEEHYELGSPWVPFKSKRITKLYAGSSNYLYGQLTNMTESFWPGPIGQSSADSNTISNTYDSVGSDWQLGRLLTSTVTKVNNGYQSSRRSSYTYNAQGAIKTETIEPLEEFATTRSYSYDSFGNVLSETLSADGLESRATTRTYSADGRFLETERNALGHTVVHEHDARTGYLLSTTDANGLASRWQTNDLGRVTSVTAPDGKVTTTQWLACGYGDCEGTDAAFQVRTRTTSGAVGHADAYEEFDRHERPVAARVLQYGNRWAVSTTDYDRLSRVVQQSAPYFQGSFTTRYLTTTQYDELGRVTEVTRPTDDQAPTGTVDRMAYNGLRQSTTDSHNRTRTLVHNARGEVIEAIDPMGGSVTHLRDGFGLIRMTTDAGFNQTTFEYDKRGLKVAMNDPSEPPRESRRLIGLSQAAIA